MNFWLVLMVLSAVAVAFVLAPLLVRREETSDDRDTLNVRLFKERVDDYAGDEDQALLEQDARRDLLQDTGSHERLIDSDDQPVQARSNGRVLIAVAILMPILALLSYTDIGLGRGSITDLRLSEQLKISDPADTERYAAFIGNLEDRLGQKPDDTDIKFILARAYSNAGRFGEAVDLYHGLIQEFPQDHNLSSFYAEALFLQSNRRLTPAVTEAVDKALQLNPMDLTMLEVKAIGAVTAGDTASALSWFKRALGTGVTGQRAELLQAAIARLESQGVTSAADAMVADTSSGRVLMVDVALDAAVVAALPPDTTVFVYARAAGGPPAPLAVQRLRLRDLPRRIRLDESMAMIEGMGLANFDQVQVIARASISGQVVPGPGDYEVRSDTIAFDTDLKEISVTIANKL